jgi:hypothetical protein
VHVVFSKSLDNYIKWCAYLPIRPVWNKYVFLNIIYKFIELLIHALFISKILRCFLLAPIL